MSKQMKYWFDEKNTTFEAVEERISDAIDLVFSEFRKYHTPQAVNAKLGLTTHNAVLAVKADWANDFARLTPRMVHSGLKKACAQDWCPTLGQFISLCKPSADASFLEAQVGMSERSRGQMGKWACPAVYWAAVTFGSLELKQANWNSHGKRWANCLSDAIERQERGELAQIPEPIPVERQLENQPTSNPQRVEALVAKAIDTMKSAGSKDWAIEPGSFKATCEMLDRAKKGWIDMTIVQHNLDVGVIEADRNWFKPVGYISRGELVLV